MIFGSEILGNKGIIDYYGHKINLFADYEYIGDGEIGMLKLRERLAYYSDSCLLYKKCFEMYKNCYVLKD